jgi:Ala-tRNA(Pro) deacylase
MVSTAKAPEEYLDGARVSFEAQRHGRVISAQKLAHELGVSGHQIAKTVLVQAGSRVWMAVLQAPDIVDLDRLGAALEVSSLRLLEEGEFAPLFPGCEPGAEPPFGRLYGVPVVVDGALARQPEIVLRAGNHEKVIRMRFADFQRLESPRVAEFAAPLAPPVVERVPAP